MLSLSIPKTKMLQTNIFAGGQKRTKTNIRRHSISWSH
jgi:hypothetical protein